MTIYVVTGRHRTGTTMMLQALAKSSNLNVIVSDEMETKIRSRELNPEEYNPNPDGYFHPGTVTCQEAPHNSLLKATSYYWTSAQPNDNLSIVHMVRDETERLMSFSKAFGQEPQSMLDAYSSGEQVIKNNPNFRVVEISYLNVILDPETAFNKLVDAGWPIVSSIAAAWVKPELYRNRI